MKSLGRLEPRVKELNQVYFANLTMEDFKLQTLVML